MVTDVKMQRHNEDSWGLMVGKRVQWCPSPPGMGGLTRVSSHIVATLQAIMSLAVILLSSYTCQQTLQTFVLLVH